MKVTKNQRGFSAVETLIIIIVLVAIGGVGYYIWHAKQTNKGSTNTKTLTHQNTPSNNLTSNTAYLTISKQNIRLPLTSEISGLKAGMLEDSGYSESDKSVAVLAPELDANWTCAADASGNKGTIGMISITTQAKRSGPGEPAVTKKLGSYTYGFEPGASNCTSDSKYSALVSAFEKQFNSLEAY
jgi:hypothetical protein